MNIFSISKRGFALISASILTGIILAIGLVLISYILSSNRTSKVHQAIMTSNQIAEAGIRKAIFCLNALIGAKCGGTYGTNYAGESDVSFGGGTYSTTIIGTGPTRTIRSVGRTGNGEFRVIQDELTIIPPTDDTDFSYALQAGESGAIMQNNSSIVGSIYSNGVVTCTSTNAVINGDAYVALAGGSINSCRVKYHAHADKILSSYIDKNAYYKNNPADITGTTVKGTKYANQTTPVPKDLPSFNLAFWHTWAEAGGTISGDYHPADNSTLGPKRINGNLIFDNNVDVTLTGPVWVVGNIAFDNNVTITLSSSYGQYGTVILADNPSDMANSGKINVYNNTAIYGSGNPKSHILLASTNSSMDSGSPALSVSNNAAGAVFYAINGMLRLQNNAGAKSLAGKKLYLDNNAVVTYLESELGDMQFSNSPSNTWRAKEGTWRESKQ